MIIYALMMDLPRHVKAHLKCETWGIRQSSISLFVIVLLYFVGCAAPALQPTVDHEQHNSMAPRYDSSDETGKDGTNAAPQTEHTLQFVGNFGGQIRGGAVRGSYAYIVSGQRLVILDVSDPTSPTVAGQSLVSSGQMYSVDVAGSHAYVSTGGSSPTSGTAGLIVFDISDPTSPVAVGTYHVGAGFFQDVFVVSDASGDDGRRYAYLAGTTFVGNKTESGLWVFDVSDPVSPINVGVFSGARSANAVHVADGYAYLLGQAAGVRVIDVSDPTAPYQVSTIPGQQWSVYVDGQYAYLAGLTVSVVDISDPTTSADSSQQVVYYVDKAGLRIIDVSDPGAPTVIGTFATSDSLIDIHVASDPSTSLASGSVEASGRSYAFAVSRTSGLIVIDVTDPANPTEVGTFATLGIAQALAVAGHYAYIADQTAGLLIVDVSDPMNPAEVAAHPLPPGWTTEVQVAGDHVYVVQNAGPLWIIDVSDPTKPEEVSTFAPDGVKGVDIVGRYAYVSTSMAGLQVLDISDPAEPIMVAASAETWPAGHVHVNGNIVYVADLNGGLFVFQFTPAVSERAFLAVVMKN